MKKQILWILAAFLNVSSLFAQSNFATVKGKVVDSEGESAAYVSVLLHFKRDSSLAKAGYSDEDGTYRLSPLNSGEYFLEIRYTGMKTYRSGAFKLADGEELQFEKITLISEDAEVGEVNIQAERPIVQVKPDMTVFNVEGNANTIGDNALELLRKAPGVVVDNNDNVILQGRSGVRIYIDGKPSPLSAEDLAAFLSSLQSSQIEAIEIITNPSSKYDAEGNAGIINIRLKKDRSLGLNGSVSLGYAVGIFSKYDGSANLNYRNKKWNLFGNYSHATGLNRSFRDFYREQNGLSFDQDVVNITEYGNHNLKVGADYFLDKKNTIGIMVNGFLRDRDRYSYSSTPIAQLENDSTLSILVAEGDNKGERQNFNFNLNYRFDNGEGTTLNLDADYGMFGLNTIAYQPNYYYDASGQNIEEESIFKTYAPTDINIWTFKADYERKALGGVVGAGVKFTYVLTDNTFSFYDVINQVEIFDSSRSNNFVYTENVNAAYLNYQRNIKKWNFQAGLRAEQTNSLGELTSTQASNNNSVKRNYLNLFPSGGVTYNVNRKNTFRLTYSRRIDRPRYQDLNPFEFKLNELSYRRGNPFLQPQYTHNIQLSHTFNYMLNTSLSYSLTNDYFTQITDTTEITRSYITQENIATRQVISLNVGLPFAPFKWWRWYTNATLFHQQNKADFGVGKEIDISRLSYSVYHQQTVQLPKEFSLQLSGFYNSPSIWGANFRNKEFWGIEAGIRKKVLQGKGDFKVSVSDIFQTMRWRGVQEFGGLYSDARGGWESRRFRLNFTYNFGNKEVKGARKRKTGLEDESGRAGGGGDSGGRGE